MEQCTIFQFEGDELATANTCDEAAAVQLLASGQSAIERVLDPGETFVTGLSRGVRYMFTTCPVGYESSVPLREENRSAIVGSQYSCTAE